VLPQSALAKQPPLLVEHTPVPEQLRPFPMYPFRHVQTLDPGVLPQSALAWQPPLLVAHSFMSLQERPFPVYPMLQVQVNEPLVSSHVARAASQLCVPSAHSFTFSLHTAPRQPAVQLHRGVVMHLPTPHLVRNGMGANRNQLSSTLCVFFVVLVVLLE
jgi:hypothetical protein